MGCFVSTNKRYPSSKFHQHSSRSSRAPPPPPVDVETVKEVLSETPNFKEIENNPKKVVSRQNSYKFRLQDHILNDPNIPEITTGFATFNHDPPSEIDSAMSESISTTTLDDDNDIYRRKMIEKSPSKSRTRSQLSGELLPKKSPVRGKDQSTGRVKIVPERNGRGPGFGSSSRQRPGSGNESAARSRSPANRNVAGGGSGCRNEIGRSLSGRRTGKSPGRVGSDLHERVRKPGSKRFVADKNNDESLENPLVSLECFIFL